MNQSLFLSWWTVTYITVIVLGLMCNRVQYTKSYPEIPEFTVRIENGRLQLSAT
jgi:hypothetical protein